MAKVQSPTAQKVRQKQMLILGATGIVTMVLAVGSAYFTGDSKEPEKQTVTVTKNLIGATTDIADREKWREMAEQDIDRLRRQMAEQQKANAQLQEMLAEINARKTESPEKAEDSSGRPAGVVPPPAGALPPPGGNRLLPGPPVPQATSNGGPVIGGPGMVMPDGSTPNLPGAGMMPLAPAVQSIKLKAPEKKPDQAAAGKPDAVASGGRPYRTGPNGERIYTENGSNSVGLEKTYIPAGSFARVVILGGVDAPTGGQAQSNPHPTLLRVIGEVHLPNGGKIDMRDCVITADAVGELSSERVQMRTQRLACVVGDNKVADVAVKGHVNGEDGKAGWRARLVTKTGAVLSNALLTGTLSALGSAIQGSTQQVVSTGLGTVTQTGASGSDIAMNAVGGGISKAFDRLSDYYIKLADKIFPVLELDSMRVGDIIFTQGFTIEAK